MNGGGLKDFSMAPPISRVLMLGNCQMLSLAKELGSNFDCRVLFRRPLIPLMSAAHGSIGRLDFDDRHSRYIIDDLKKDHLKQIENDDSEHLIFDLISDLRCPLIRVGGSYFVDPNLMNGLVADAPPADERHIDCFDLLGTDRIDRIDSGHGEFFSIWADHFDRFYRRVLSMFLGRGGRVICQQVFHAKQVVESAPYVGANAAHCDRMNALLDRMYAHIRAYPAVDCIALPKRLTLTSADAPDGGLHYLHPIKETFEIIAEKARAIMSYDDRDDAFWRRTTEKRPSFDAAPKASRLVRLRRRIFERVGLFGTAQRIVGFDERYYLHWYPDVQNFRDGAVDHYLRFGWKELRDPSAAFSTSGYLAANPDVAELDICPLLHFNETGFIEGRTGWRKRNLLAPAPPPRDV